MAAGQTSEEDVQGVGGLDAQYGALGTGHAQIGDETGALGQDLAVGGGDVGVGAPDALGLAVQIPCHGALLAGGLGMEVQQSDVILPLAAVQKVGGHSEGVVQIGVELDAAHEVHHRDAHTLALEDVEAAAGEPAGVVVGAQESWLLLHVLGDLDAVPGVVAQGDGVGPGVKEPLGLTGQDAHAGAVFSVDHGEMDVVRRLQLAQAAGEDVLSAFAHHVAHGENVEKHDENSPL